MIKLSELMLLTHACRRLPNKTCDLASCICCSGYLQCAAGSDIETCEVLAAQCMGEAVTTSMAFLNVRAVAWKA